jgi:hypothetical protein
VLFFDSNKNFHAHPNKEIGNGGHFLSILDLEFSIQFISELKFLHPNRPLDACCFFALMPSMQKKRASLSSSRHQSATYDAASATLLYKALCRRPLGTHTILR